MQTGQWRQEIESGGMLQINQIGSNNYSKNAKETRNLFKTHFNSKKAPFPGKQIPFDVRLITMMRTSERKLILVLNGNYV